MSDVERKYDLYSQTFKHNAYATFAAMRQDDPIYRQLGLDGSTPIWFITSYEDVEAMLRDKRFVRDQAKVKGYTLNALDQLLDNHMLNRDGVDHLRLRNLVSQAFTPKRIEALRPRVEAIAQTLLEQLKPKGEMDLVADFSFPLPTIVILEMLGIPTQDREKFKVWANALIAPRMNDEDNEQAVQHLSAFIQ